MTLFALAIPFAGTALAVVCTQSEAETITITAGGGPETNAFGSQHSVTAHVENAAAADCEDVLVDFQIMSGPNSGAASHQQALTNVNGDVVFTYTDANGDVDNASNTDNFTVWVDVGPDNNSIDGGEISDSGTKTWGPEPETIALTGPTTAVNSATVTYDFHVEDINGDPYDSVGGVVSCRDLNNNDTGDDIDNQSDANGDGECQLTHDGTGDFNVRAWVEPFPGQDFGGGRTFNHNHLDDCGPTLEPCDDHATTFQAAAATFLDVVPDRDTNPTGQSHQLTATVFDQAGDPFAGNTTVNFELFNNSPNDVDGNTTGSPDETCNTGGTSTCNVDYNGFNGGNDNICSWIGTAPTLGGTAASPTCGGEGISDATGDQDAGDPEPASGAPDSGGVGPNDDQDLVRKAWQAPVAGGLLEVTEETASNPTGQDHTLTAHVFSSGNTHASAATIIDFEFTGANDADGNTPGTPDATCTTDNTGHCDIDMVADGNMANSNAVGTTQIRAWISPNASGGASEADMAEGRISSNTTDCLTGDGVQNDPAGACDGTATPGTTGERDNTDVVQKTWTGPAFALTLTPPSSSAAVGACNPFTVTVTDQAGNGVSGEQIDFLQTFQGTAPSNTDLDFCDEAEIPTAAGTTRSAVDEDTPPDSDQSSANDEVEGEFFGNCNDGTPATSPPPCDSVEHGEAERTTNSSGQVTIGIESNQTGTVRLDAFIDDNTNDQPDDILQDNSTKTWTAGGAAGVTNLDAEPETDSNPVGTQHTITATATNAQGNPVPNVTVNFEILDGSPNDANGADPGDGGDDDTDTTDANGVAEFVYAGANAGTDNIRAWVNQAGGTLFSDTGEPQDDVQKTWTAPPTGLEINVTCVGSDPDDTGDPEDSSAADAGSPDCTNPLSDTSETFTALVFDPQGPGTGDDLPQSGIQVQWNITGEQPTTPESDTPGFSPPPSGQTAGTDGPVFCTTDASGRCSVTVTNPTPSDGDFADVRGRIFGQTPNTDDTATKEWQAGVLELTLTPESDVNQTGGQHTVTATVADQFGNPSAGVNVDFQVTGRNNSGVTGFDRSTNAQGQATFTYTDTGPAAVQGTDNIEAWADNVVEDDFNGPTEPDDDATKLWITEAAVAADVELDMIPTGADSLPGENNAQTCNGDLTNFNSATWESTDDDPLNRVHLVCVSAKTAGGVVLEGSSVTLTSSGVGVITDRNGPPPADTTQTKVIEGDGYARFWIHSADEAGTQNLTATVDSASDTGTKNWQAGNARIVDLEPETDSNVTGTVHEVTATVTDSQGNGVPGVTVTFTETGTGFFVGGGSTFTAVTNSQGVATAQTTTNGTETGNQSITASINPNTAGVDCELGANNPNTGDPAGVCTDTVEKTWTEDDADGDGPTGGPCGNLGPFGSEVDTDNDGDPDVFIGTHGDDVMTGTEEDDVMCGLGGNDTIDGLGGDDVIVGNRGQDSIDSGAGSDNVQGGRGRDEITGRGGDDTLRGGPGVDTLRAGFGDDTARGGGDNDVVRGGPGNDTLVGGIGGDTLRGGGGNDTLKGNKGRDTLVGGGGNDTVVGGLANDLLRGGRGRDTLRGGPGNDVLFGGPGDDFLGGGRGFDRCRPGRGSDVVAFCEA